MRVYEIVPNKVVIRCIYDGQIDTQLQGKRGQLSESSEAILILVHFMRYKLYYTYYIFGILN